MKKYNKSNIMKEAWRLFRTDDGIKITFSMALKLAWKQAKKVVKTDVQSPKMTKKIIFTNIEKWFLNKMESVNFMALESGIAVKDIVLERETEKAIQISTEWNGYRKFMWFPKSVISYK